jgi:hypothetical protein
MEYNICACVVEWGVGYRGLYTPTDQSLFSCATICPCDKNCSFAENPSKALCHLKVILLLDHLFGILYLGNAKLLSSNKLTSRI